MKKFTYLIYLFSLLSFSVMAEESVTIDTLVIFNGETINGLSEGYGAPFEIIANPETTGINKTDSVIQVGRTTANWWEYFNVTIDTTLWGTDCFFEMMINYPAQPDIAFRPGAYYRSDPSELYDTTALNTWQTVRFDASASIGESFTTMRLYPDLGQMVLSSLDFGYIDEIKLISITKPLPSSVDQELCNFEDAITMTSAYGATNSIVSNPQKDTNNGSDSCLQIGRTGGNWYELTDIPLTEFRVPTSEECYIHILVKSSEALKISLRPNSEGGDLLARNPYRGGNQWQDVVFNLGKIKDVGYKMKHMRLLADHNMVLDNDSILAYFDEVIVNGDPTPRIDYGTTPETIDSIFYTFEEVGSIECRPAFGAIANKVINPDKSELSINQTDSCLQLGDNVVEEWACIDFDVDLFTPDSACYLHVMLRSTVSPNFLLRTLDDNSTDIEPMDSLNPFNEWQDLVFDISSVQEPGFNIKGLRFMLDFKEDNLNSTTNLLYFDEVIISADSTVRVKEVSSVKDNSMHSRVSFHPNPASDLLYISGEGAKSATFFNISGQEVLNVVSLGNSIDINMLNNGVYVVRCHDDQGNLIAIERVIKN